MPQLWHFGGIALNTPAWNVEQISEGIGVPGKRGENLQVPFLSGRRWKKKIFDDRHVILNFWVRGVDKTTGLVPAGQTQYETLLQNIDYLSGIFGSRGQKTLRRTFPDGTYREAQAEVYNSLPFPIVHPQRHAKFSVDFLLADPFFYAPSKTTDTQTVNETTEEYTVNNPGTAPATKMIITLDGPLESPKIENTTTGVWLQYNGSIGTGEQVVINTEDFACELDGDNMISAIKHAGDMSWMILDPGDNSIEITCDSAPSGSAKFEFYAPYF